LKQKIPLKIPEKGEAEDAPSDSEDEVGK